MVRMSAIIIAVVISAATAEAQNYSRFLHEAERALANEFWKLGQQDWQEWDATCWRLQDNYPYSDCRAKLLAIRQERAQGGDFFDSDCD